MFLFHANVQNRQDLFSYFGVWAAIYKQSKLYSVDL